MIDGSEKRIISWVTSEFSLVNKDEIFCLSNLRYAAVLESVLPFAPFSPGKAYSQAIVFHVNFPADFGFLH